MEIDNTGLETEPQEPEVEKLSRGAKIAAIALIINAVFVLMEFFIFGTDISDFRQISSLVIDIVLGIMLLLNKKHIKIWVMVRAAAGLVLFSIIHAVNQDYVLLIIQVIFSLSLIGLLAGKPKAARITVSTLLITCYFLVEMAAIIGHVTGVPIIQQFVAGFSYQLEEETGDTCPGLAYNYTVSLPHAKWKIRKDEAVKKENEVVDRWLILTNKDAHVLIIGEDFDETMDLSPEVYETAIMSIAETNLENFEIIAKEEIEVNTLQGRLARTRGEISGMKLEYIYAMFIKGSQAFQVICFTRQSTMPQVEEDFMQIIGSFRL